ncbi:uncharacterized protein isoform X1 [Macaca fascicularis]|uniref:uncharacterized protein isoform X1 n=1 Tax=Macaca fascicularis TaxID=9541 RepID=UPI0032B02533
MGIIGSQGGNGQVAALNCQRQGGHNYCNGHQRQSSNQNSLTHVELWHWLITVFLEVKLIGGMLHSYLYKQKTSKSNRQKTNLNYKNRELQPLHQFPDLRQFIDSEPLERRGGQVPSRKDHTLLLTIYAVNLFYSLSQGDLWPFTRVTVQWRKGNDPIFGGLLDTGSELTLIPEDPKHHCGPPVKVGAYGGQAINGVLAQVRPTVDPQTHPLVISPMPECIVGIDILSSWQNPHIGSLTGRVKATVVGKAKWKPLEMLLPSKIINQNQYRIPGGIAEISATIKDLKDTGVVIPTTSPLNSPI